MPKRQEVSEPLWRTWVFDCDGVVLNSNAVKTEAMFRAASVYGRGAAEKLREHHVRNGGVSRDLKFQWFFAEVVTPNKNVDQAVEELKCAYGAILEDALRDCEEATGLRELLCAIKAQGAACFVVSGGDQGEVRNVLEERGLAGYFEGVFGAPDSKEDIVGREVEAGNIQRPAIMLGDSKYDYVVASAYEMDFVFLTGWTDFASWREFFRGKKEVRIETDIGAVLYALEKGPGL